MNIGIISFWDDQSNYGQILQCFALQKFLRNMNHRPFHVKYVEGGGKRQKIANFAYVLFHGYLFDWIKSKRGAKRDDRYVELNRLQAREDEMHPRDFDGFRDRHLTFTRETYRISDLCARPPEADCYICGSDQIWAYPDAGYMLDFGPRGVKRIAYAASMGGNALADRIQRSRFARRLKRLDIVSLRENDGVEVCREAGRKDAFLAPDPVFLLPAEEYRSIAKRGSADGEYVLVYLLGNEIDVDVREIFSFARSRGLDVKYVTSKGRFDEFPKTYPSIEEWLGLMDAAKYVVTNSFHGMALSIILNKDFAVLPLSGERASMNSRITTTLEHYGLSERMEWERTRDSFDGERIDYSAINLKLRRQREHYKELFAKWLGEAEGGDSPKEAE